MIAKRNQMIKEISDITVKIIHCFSSERENPRISDGCYVDIELMEKAENLYYICVTNYNRDNVYLQNNSIIFERMRSMLSRLKAAEPIGQNYLRTIILVTTGGENETPRGYDFQFVNNSSCSISNESVLDYLTQKKNYLTARLECKMLPANIFMFKSSVIEELEKLDTLENNLRYVFRSGDKVFWRNKFQVQTAFGSCKRVSQAVTTICKYSSSRSFRKKCSRIIGCSEESNFGDAILEQMLSLICQKHHKDRGEGKDNRAETENNGIM